MATSDRVARRTGASDEFIFNVARSEIFGIVRMIETVWFIVNGDRFVTRIKTSDI